MKKVLIISIAIYFLALIKLIKIFLKKKELFGEKLIDNIAIKIILFWNKKKTYKERIDFFILILLGYILVFFFNCSLKSVILVITLYNIIKYSIISERKLETFLRLIKKKLREEFFISTSHLQKVIFLGLEIKISHSINK